MGGGGGGGGGEMGWRGGGKVGKGEVRLAMGG